MDFEQGGERRAVYGEARIKPIGVDLSHRFGRGSGQRHLTQKKALFLSKPMEQPLQTPSAQFTGSQAVALQTRGADTFASLSRLFPQSWSTYVLLLSVRTAPARTFYETEALRCGWSVRQIGRPR